VAKTRIRAATDSRISAATDSRISAAELRPLRQLAVLAIGGLS
jgi:hypothetical protein